MYTPVQDVRAFLAERGTKRVREHDFSKLRVCHWPCCSQCGLLALKNDVSRAAARGKCVVYE